MEKFGKALQRLPPTSVKFVIFFASTKNLVPIVRTFSRLLKLCASGVVAWFLLGLALALFCAFFLRPVIINPLVSIIFVVRARVRATLRVVISLSVQEIVMVRCQLKKNRVRFCSKKNKFFVIKLFNLLFIPFRVGARSHVNVEVVLYFFVFPPINH